MIQTSYHIWPDNKTLSVFAYTCENDVKRFQVPRKFLQCAYGDMTMEEAIYMYAVTRFTLFHDIDFSSRFTSSNWINRRNSV